MTRSHHCIQTLSAPTRGMCVCKSHSFEECWGKRPISLSPLYHPEICKPHVSLWHIVYCKPLWRWISIQQRLCGTLYYHGKIFGLKDHKSIRFTRLSEGWTCICLRRQIHTHSVESVVCVAHLISWGHSTSWRVTATTFADVPACVLNGRVAVDVGKQAEAEAVLVVGWICETVHQHAAGRGVKSFPHPVV